MVRNFAYAMGAIFLLIGITGFVPALTPDEHILGVFMVNTAHNIVHLVSGALLVGAAIMGRSQAVITSRVFGVIYGLVSVLGFALPGGDFFGFMKVNLADNLANLAFSAALLYVGFGARMPGRAAQESEPMQSAESAQTMS